jgi:hypothetical protein
MPKKANIDLEDLLPSEIETTERTLLDITKEFFTSSSDRITELFMKSNIEPYQLGAVLALDSYVNQMALDSGQVKVYKDENGNIFLENDENFPFIGFIEKFLKLRTSVKGRHAELFSETLKGLQPKVEEKSGTGEIV